MSSFEATIATTYTKIADFSAQDYQKDNLSIASNGSQKIDLVWYFGDTNPKESQTPDFIVNAGLASSLVKKAYVTRNGELWGRCESATLDVVVNTY